MSTTEQITGRQVVLLVTPTIFATGIMALPAIASHFAGPDAWASPMLASVTGIWAALVISGLAARYPGMTLMEAGDKIVGKWINKLIGAYYCFYILLAVGIMGVELSGFISQFSLPKTPTLLTHSAVIILSGMAVWLGIEVIARCAEALIPLTILFIIAISLLLLPDMKPEYLQPVFGHGLVPVLQGAFTPSGWAGQVFIFGFLIPHLKNPRTLRRDLFIGVVLATMILIVTTGETIMVNGILTPRLNFPYYAAAQYVSVARFIDRIDPVVLSLWIFGGFIKLSIWMYVFVVAVSQLFGLKNYRVLVVPLTLVVVLCQYWLFPSAMKMMTFLVYTIAIPALIADNLIPTSLLLIDLVRKGRRTVHG